MLTATLQDHEECSEPYDVMSGTFYFEINSVRNICDFLVYYGGAKFYFLFSAGREELSCPTLLLV